MLNGLARLVRRILLALGGFFLGIGMYLAVAQGILHNPMPMPFGVGAAVVLSGSMEPALKVDDLLIVRQTREVDVGDVIVYQSGANLVVHRVVISDGESIVTRGDANNVNDAPISAEAVKGVVVKNLRGVGAWLRAVRTPGGLIVILLLVFLLPELIYSLGNKGDEKRIEAMKEEIRQLRAMMAEEEQAERGG